MIEKTYYTYLHCKPNGDPFYVGKGSGKRAYILNRRNPVHANIVKKYGAKNIGVFIFDCQSEEEAFQNEISDIAQLKKDGFVLANVTNGGEGVSGLKKVTTEEQRRKLSIAGIGNKNALGWRHTQESKSKMNLSRKSNPVLYKRLVDILRAANSKKVICVETGETFQSATEAAIVMGFKSRASITKVCRGVAKSARGLTFKYQS